MAAWLCFGIIDNQMHRETSYFISVIFIVGGVEIFQEINAAVGGRFSLRQQEPATRWVCIESKGLEVE